MTTDHVRLAWAAGQEAAQRAPLTAVTLDDFLAKDLPPRTMLLSPIIPVAGLAMIYAPRGVGKTHVALNIAYAIASGSDYFDGRWTCDTPRRVLFVDGEMPAASLQERLARIVASAARQPPTPEHLRIITPDLQADPLPDLASQEGQDALAPLVEGADLVVLDNLSSLCRAGKENEGESWLPVQQWALGLRRAGKAVLFVHHSGKSGQQRGTSRREDVLDTVIALRRPDDYQPQQGARFHVHVEKARSETGDALAPFEARLQTSGGRAEWITRTLEDAKAARVAQLRDEGLSVREISEETGIPKSTVALWLKR